MRAGRFLRPAIAASPRSASDFASVARACGSGRRWRSAGIDFTVVGVLDKTLTAPDRFAFVPIDDAREVWLRRDPLLVQVFGTGGLNRADLNSGVAVGWAAGAGSRRAGAADPGRRCRGERDHPRRGQRAAPRSRPRSSPRSCSGIAALGLVIGGLSLSNTVTAAVFERIRDFGIKRALGATDVRSPARGDSPRPSA